MNPKQTIHTPREVEVYERFPDDAFNHIGKGVLLFSAPWPPVVADLVSLPESLARGDIIYFAATDEMVKNDKYRVYERVVETNSSVWYVCVKSFWNRQDVLDAHYAESGSVAVTRDLDRFRRGQTILQYLRIMRGPGVPQNDNFQKRAALIQWSSTNAPDSDAIWVHEGLLAGETPLETLIALQFR